MFDDESFTKMRDACKGRSNAPWFRQDLSKPEPQFGHGYAVSLYHETEGDVSTPSSTSKSRNEGCGTVGDTEDARESTSVIAPTRPTHTKY
jgi:hypothetical protein